MSPAPPNSTLGNAVTAQRYAKIFRAMGLKCSVRAAYGGEPAAALVGLHARKSAESILAFRAAYARRPIILVLTGTDVYGGLMRGKAARDALEAADAIVALQPEALRELPPKLRRKARAIVQSAPARPHARRGKRFRICVLGHVRPEKDPMRAAYAARILPRDLPVEVLHAGEILHEKYRAAIERERLRNPRYRYLGALPRGKALRLLASSDLLVQSSRMEGGANAICEAIACGTPVIASRIPGNTGILGRRYPGLYPAGDTRALAALIERAAASPAFYRRLQAACNALRPIVEPRHEAAAWRDLFASLR